MVKKLAKNSDTPKLKNLWRQYFACEIDFMTTLELLRPAILLSLDSQQMTQYLIIQISILGANVGKLTPGTKLSEF